MLTKLSLEAAEELTEMLDKEDRIVTPDEGTPIARLVEAGLPVERDLPETTEEAKESLTESTFTPVMAAVNDHDAISEAEIQRVATLMNKRIHLAQGEINPIIIDYASNIKTYLTDIVPTTPEIIEVEFSPVYDEPMLAESVAPYVYKHMDYIHTLKNDTQIDLSIMKTGLSFIDNEIDRIVAKYGAEEVRNALTQYFIKGNDYGLLVPDISSAYQRAVDINFLIYFYAKALLNATEPMTAPVNYSATLKAIINVCAQNIKNVIEYKNGLETSGTITKTIAGPEDVITSVEVYKDNYDIFLKHGGSKSAIMGYTRRRRSYFSMEDLLENADALAAIYDNEKEQELKDLRHRALDHIKRAALKALPQTVGKIVDLGITDTFLEKENVGDRAESLRILVQRGNDFINNHSGVIDPEYIEGYAYNIVLIGLIPELDLLSFFNRMNELMKPAGDGTSLNPKQAAYYACLEEIVAFFASQCTMSPSVENRKYKRK